VLVSEHRLERLLPAVDSVSSVAQGRIAAPAAPAPPAAALSHPHRNGRVPRRSGAGAEAWSLRGATLHVGAAEVLRDVDASGCTGEVVVIMGKNGAGKTTLLRAIAGLLRPSSGRVERRPGRIAYLPQNPTAMLHQPTVRAEIELTLRSSRERGDPLHLLEALGLSAAVDRYPRDLSTGERQRAALAAVLAGAPGIALLDEPTRGMDGAARDSLAAVLDELCTAGVGVVLATHDSQLAERVGHRVLLLEEGRVRDHGRTSRVLPGAPPPAAMREALAAP
jgi:energy-coupling factor transport system ATP-binding protein